MRKPETVEKLYLDFDGFFASVMQQAYPRLRGLPVGVIPFEIEGDGIKSTIVIACSKEAKALGCKNVMPVPEALALCPSLVLVTQRPDLFRRAHHTLLNEIACEIPIETVKSIDEMACKLDACTIADPVGLSRRIKVRIRKNVGDQITCSIGFAANRLLAKIACKMDKPNGVTIWRPEDMPGPLLPLPISTIPGVGPSMERRLNAAGIYTMQELWDSQPKHLRAIWKSVNGERMWYALHGYDLHAQPTQRGMYGHGRVLPPEWRNLERAYECSRLLLTKAARRMRRDGYCADRLWLGLSIKDGYWGDGMDLASVQDDQGCLAGLKAIWERARAELPKRTKVFQFSVTLGDLTQAKHRQLDLLLNDDRHRQRCERLTIAIDGLNRQFGKRMVTIGPWTPPPGGFAGGKISYNRIPSAEDFF